MVFLGLLFLQWAGAILVGLALLVFLPLGEVGPALLCLWVAGLLWGVLWLILRDSKERDLELRSRITPP